MSVDALLKHSSILHLNVCKLTKELVSLRKHRVENVARTLQRVNVTVLGVLHHSDGVATVDRHRCHHTFGRFLDKVSLTLRRHPCV